MSAKPYGSELGIVLPWGSITPLTSSPLGKPEEGYGIGGYGIIEPWGSVHYDQYIIPNRNLLANSFLGIIEATAGVIGETDAEIAGFRITRLKTVVNKGDTSIQVESLLGWPEEGKISINGVVYYYDYSIGTTLYDIHYKENNVIVYGVAQSHRIESPVIDVSKQYSALDLVRRQLLVDYAEGEYLNILGRNLGVFRIPIFGEDDTFRELIKVLAYCPKTTIFCFELVLDILLGQGNYEIYEDLIKNPFEIFIKIKNELPATANSIGKTYHSGTVYGFNYGASFNQVDLGIEPISISYIKLKNLEEVFSFKGSIPSGVVYPYYPNAVPSNAFDYSGDILEGNVIDLINNETRFKTGSNIGTAFYTMPDTKGARLDLYSTKSIEIEWLLKIPNTTILDSGEFQQISLALFMNWLEIQVGIDSDYSIGFFVTEGFFMGNSVVLSLDTYNSIKIIRVDSDYIELWVNGVFVDRQAILDFNNNPGNKIEFGIRRTVDSDIEFYTKQLSVYLDNSRDYNYNDIRAKGVISESNPTYIDLGSGPTYYFDGTELGKEIELLDSLIINSYGGNNNGKWLVKAVLTTTRVEIAGILRGGASVDSDNPTRITVDDYEAFKYPDDLGKPINLLGSLPNNNGEWTIVDLLDSNGNSFSNYNYQGPRYTNICVVNGVSFSSEQNISYKIQPLFYSNEVSRRLRISNLVFSSGAIANMKPDTVFLWKNDLLLEIGITTVLSGQLLKNWEIRNICLEEDPLVYKYYPFYLSDYIGNLQTFLDKLTAAGVIPSFKII